MSLIWKPLKEIWANAGNTNTFEPKTFQARSYSHWKYVDKIKNFVVFNDYSYSATTSKHQFKMRHFLRTELGVNMDKVVYINQPESLDRGIFLDSFYATLALAEFRLKLPNRRAAFYKDQKSIIDNCKKNIKVLKNLGATAKIKLTNHRINARVDEEQRLTDQREKSKAARSVRKAVVNEFKSQYESTQAVEV
jgi:hypothetical protein